MTSPVSVIIPTCNRPRLILRALQSVYQQTSPPGEVIVIDDGSSPPCGAEIKGNFPEVIYEWQENRGVSAARNRGMRIAMGEWMAFLDSDDTWMPAKLAVQFAALAEQPEHRICHTEELWMRRGVRVNPRKKHRKYGGWIYQKCLPLCVISPSSVLIHRSIFQDVGCFDEQLLACEDYDLWLRVCARYPVLFIDVPQITKYGGHADQLSRRYPAMDRLRLQALDKMLATNILGPEDYLATLRTAISKAGVYAAGAAKRNKLEEARHYRSKIVQYQQLLTRR